MFVFPDLWRMYRKKWGCHGSTGAESQAKLSCDVHLNWLMSRYEHWHNNFVFTWVSHNEPDCARKMDIARAVVESCATQLQLFKIVSTLPLETCAGVLSTIRKKYACASRHISAQALWMSDTKQIEIGFAKDELSCWQFREPTAVERIHSQTRISCFSSWPSGTNEQKARMHCSDWTVNW